MALFDFDEMLIGTKKLATKIYNATGELFTSTNPGLVKIKNTTEESVPVQLSGRIESVITIANAVAITDTNEVAFTTNGIVDQTIMRQYKEFKISLYNTHNKNASVSVYSPVVASGGLTLRQFTELYKEDGILTSYSVLLLQHGTLGAGSGAKVKSIPALQGVYSGIIVKIKFAEAPTIGALTIKIEAH